MTKPVPACAAFVGLLLAGASLSAPTRISPRLLKSSNSLWLPFVRAMGLRMKMSIEYSTLPRALRGASSRSVITALRGSSGSTSPKALPRSFSYGPTLPSGPNVRPSNAGDSDRAGSMTMRVMWASAGGASGTEDAASTNATSNRRLMGPSLCGFIRGPFFISAGRRPWQCRPLRRLPPAPDRRARRSVQRHRWFPHRC